MSEFYEWFKREIHDLGFAGLEGVYDYLATMSDAQVLEYLESLLGSEKRITEFANRYIQQRSHGKQKERPAVSQSSTNDAELDWAQTTRASSKAKRGRGKDRKLGKGSKQSQQENKSFARIVSKDSASSSNTEQTKAIHDAPVERMRQQLREYRKTKRPINCIHCGKIECPVPEDGACSFCRSSLFSIWEPSEKRRGATGFTHSEERTAHKKVAVKYCSVFGRYVQRPILNGNVYVQPKLKDLAGRAHGTRRANDVGEANNKLQCLTKADIHSSRNASAKQKNQSEGRLKEGKHTRKTESVTSNCVFAVQGRLLVDGLQPSAYLPDPKRGS